MGEPVVMVIAGVGLAILVVGVLPVIGLWILHNRIEKLDKMYRDMWDTLERIWQRLEPGRHEDIPRS